MYLHGPHSILHSRRHQGNRALAARESTVVTSRPTQNRLPSGTWTNMAMAGRMTNASQPLAWHKSRFKVASLRSRHHLDGDILDDHLLQGTVAGPGLDRGDGVQHLEPLEHLPEHRVPLGRPSVLGMV